MNTQSTNGASHTPAAHTPLPWAATYCGSHLQIHREGWPRDAWSVCSLDYQAQDKANAELIVKAVNSHAELVAFANNAVPLLYLFKALLNETWLDAKPALRAEIEKKISAVAQVCKAGDRLIDAEAMKGGAL